MKHLVSLNDVSPADLQALLAVSRKVKAARSAKTAPLFRPLLNASVALLFEKPSLRTRVTFEVAVTELGGHPIYLGPQEVGLGRRESVSDIAQNMSRWIHAIVARTFQHESVAGLARTARVPVINALTDREHPCQAVGDILTILERRGRLKGLTLAFVGDGNNVCNSLLYAAAKTGLSMRVACPPGFEPAADVLAAARAAARISGARLAVTHDPVEAVRNADAVYTDVWVSMGFESEAAPRRQAFEFYRVDGPLMSRARPDAIFLHCLPARRGEEVTDEVMDGKQSAVLDQAENRLHSAKAVLLAVMAPAVFGKLAALGRRKTRRRSG